MIDINKNFVQTIAKLFFKHDDVFGNWDIVAYGKNDYYGDLFAYFDNNDDFYIQFANGGFTGLSEWDFYSKNGFTDAMIEKIISMADVLSDDTDFIDEPVYYKLHKYNKYHIELEFVY